MSGLDDLADALHQVRDQDEHSPHAETCHYCRDLAAKVIHQMNFQAFMDEATP